jgi:hypothetical protein
VPSARSPHKCPQGHLRPRWPRAKLSPRIEPTSIKRLVVRQEQSLSCASASPTCSELTSSKDQSRAPARAELASGKGSVRATDADWGKDPERSVVQNLTMVPVSLGVGAEQTRATAWVSAQPRGRANQFGADGPNPERCRAKPELTPAKES